MTSCILKENLTTRFCLVRHGETDWNAERRMQGHTDIPLNAVGQTQALAAAQGLCEVEFQVAYSSDLSRAKETAQIILADRPCSRHETVELRERHFGLAQGLTCGEFKLQWPQDYQAFIAREANTPFPGGGETLNAFYQRVVAVLESMAQQHAGQTVLVVTHGGVLDIIYRYVIQQPLTPPRQFGLHNAAINWVVHTPESGWQIERWDDRKHLGITQDELPSA